MTTESSNDVRIIRNALPLAAVLGVVALAVGASSLFFAYRAELEDEQAWLVEIARNQTRFIESVAAFDARSTGADDPWGWLEGTLSQVRQAQAEARGWGETGELHLVALEADTLASLLGHRDPGVAPGTPDWHSPDLDGVLRKALTGESGVEILPNRPAEPSLVAYEPVRLPGGRMLGLAVTLDVAEVRAPFVRTGLILGVVAIVLIILGSMVTRWLAGPTFRALEESERRYRQLFEESAEAILISAFDGTVLECNQAAAELFQTSMESVVGTSVATFYPDPRQREKLLRRLQAEGQVRGQELHLVRPNGSEFTCLATIHFRREDGGAAQGSLEVLLTDITERKRAEDALKASEARYFDMFEHAPDMLLSVDTGTDLIRECNAAVLRGIGFTREEILQRSISDLCAPGSMESAGELSRLVHDTGAAEGIELEILRKDGSSFPTGVNAAGIRDEEGGLVALRLSLRDLTEERQLTERLDRILEGTRDGLWEWPRLDRDELWWSEGFFRLLGFEPDEFQPTLDRFNELVHPEDREQVGRRMVEYLEAGGAFENEYRIRRKDGGYAWLQARGWVYMDPEGRPSRMAGSVRDISEQRQAEEALLKSMMREQAAGDQARLYLHAAEAIMVGLDASGRVEMINRKGCELLGCQEAEILGRDWFDSALPEWARGEVRRIHLGAVAGEIEPAVYFENAVLSRSGEERLVAWHNAYLRNEEGRITGVVSSGQDVTDLRAVEASLELSEDRLRALYSSVRAGVILQGAGGEILHANAEAEEIFRLPVDEIEGRLPRIRDGR